MRIIWIAVVMLGASGHIGYGQDVTLVMDTCYNIGDTMTIEARYIGSETILNVEWYITGATMMFTMNIPICLPFGTPDPAFPTSKMTYGCPETAGSNTFRFNVAGLVKTDFNKEWGAKFILTTGHTTSLLRKTVTQCVQIATVTLYNDGLKPTSDQFIEVTDGVEKTLTCAPGTSIPAATISWYIGTKKLATSWPRLIFTPTNDNHNKTVHCKAYNLQPESQAVSSNTPSLYVNVPARTPTLANKTTSGNLVVLSGEETHLICITSATRPSSSVIWKKGKNSFGTERNTEHFEDGGLISVTSVVKFIPENIDNNVVITCETSISVQTTIQSVQQTIEVWYAPDVDAVLSTSRLIENSSVRATCKATGRPNAYTYIALEQTWMGTVIHNTHSHIPGTDTYSSLDIASLQLHDTGNYTCHVNNGVPDRSGMLDQTATVNIKVEVDGSSLQGQSSGAIVGGVIGGLVVVVVTVVVIAVLLTRKYQLEGPCHRKIENPDDLKPVRDGVISTERNMSTPDSMSYYNAVVLSDPSSQYTTLTNRESASNNYDSLHSIELQETRPSTTIYENLEM